MSPSVSCTHDTSDILSEGTCLSAGVLPQHAGPLEGQKRESLPEQSGHWGGRLQRWSGAEMQCRLQTNNRHRWIPRSYSRCPPACNTGIPVTNAAPQGAVLCRKCLKSRPVLPLTTWSPVVERWHDKLNAGIPHCLGALLYQGHCNKNQSALVFNALQGDAGTSGMGVGC
jgi:hypothetical protein